MKVIAMSEDPLYNIGMKARKETALTARIDTKVKMLADKYCKSKGLVMARFVEEAILDKLEECHDASEIEALRREPVRPFEEVLKELKFYS